MITPRGGAPDNDTQPSVAATENAQRIDHIDALRGSAIILVIFGHFIEPYIQYYAYRAVYIAIYMFHVPLLVFISGERSKKLLKTHDYNNMMRYIILPLFIFDIIYKFFNYYITKGVEYSIITPYWHLWFLLSLIIWRLALPLAASPAGFTVAVVLALIAGYDPGVGYALSASRTIYFFPFFIAGFLWGPAVLQFAQRFRWVGVSIFSLLVVVAIASTQAGIDPRVLRGSVGFDGTPVNVGGPAAGRMMLLLLGFVGISGFASLVPRTSAMLQFIGRRSLSIYILHGFFVVLMNAWLTALEISSVVMLPGFLILSIQLALTLGCTEKHFRNLFAKIHPEK